MGPFSNNISPQPPKPDRSGNLPVPDVNAPVQTVVVASENDFGSTKKWLNVTLIIAAIMAFAAVVVFGVYVFVTNTPNYMLSAAVTNLAHSDGVAGDITYETKQAGKTVQTDGDFLAYSDPTNTKQGMLTLSIGQNSSRISAVARVFDNGSYVQTAGLGNLGRLIKAIGGDSTKLTNDELVQLSSLDNRWYTVSPADMPDIDALIRQHTVQGNVSSDDLLALERLYVDNPFVVVNQELPDERISGINSMHLKLAIDRNKLGDYLQAVKDARLTAVSITDADIKWARESAELTKVQIEVWISRSDRVFQQIKVIAPNGIDTALITFKSEVVATQRQSVVRPEGAQSLTKLVKGLHDSLLVK